MGAWESCAYCALIGERDLRAGFIDDIAFRSGTNLVS